MKAQAGLLLVSAIGFFLVPIGRAATKCSDQSLSGDYAYSATGFMPEMQKGGPPRYVPISQVAVITYDGKGVVNFRATQQDHGSLTPIALYGQYEIKDNCVGKAFFKDRDGAVVEWRFVVVQGGSQVETLALQPASGGRPQYSLTFSQKRF
jgi:hypothetical protein